jgi:hypothetical protein
MGSSSLMPCSPVSASIKSSCKFPVAIHDSCLLVVRNHKLNEIATLLGSSRFIGQQQICKFCRDAQIWISNFAGASAVSDSSLCA